MEEPERTIYIAELITFAAISVLSVILTIIRDHIPMFNDILTCKFRQISQIPCPGCGGTRAVINLMHGHIFSALYYHAAAVYIVILAWLHYLWRDSGECGSECTRCKKAWIEAALEDGVEIHEPDSLEDYSGQFKLRISRNLHRSLAEHSQREGINMNQYCVYLLSRNDAVFSK